MKNLFLALTMASAAIVATSCCGKGECSTNGIDTTLSKATVDSIALAEGSYIGQAILSNYPRMAQDGIDSKEDIIKGIQLAINSGDNRSTVVGMQFGIQMLNEMKQLEDAGIKVDKELVLKAFKNEFLKDSTDQSQAEMTYGSYQMLVEKAQHELQAKKDAVIAASPEAIANVEAGKAYADSVKAANPSAKVSDSGLTYIIVEPGDTTTIDNRTRLTVLYTEKNIGGEIINTTNDTPRTIYMSNITPGLAEGLKNLGKGGKATLVVPGELAYGLHGLPSRNVGPNETVVYDIEVVDVIK